MRFNPGRFGATTMAQLRMTFRRRVTLFDGDVAWPSP